MKKIFVGFASIALFAMLVVACANAAGGSTSKSEDKGSKNGGSYFTIEDGVITAYDRTKIPADGHVVIPDGVTKIGNLVWFGEEVKSVTIPSTLTPSDRFRKLEGLESVTFAEGITSIPRYMFMNCSKLTTIHFPKTLDSIEEQAFSNTGLTSITLPEGVTSISGFDFCKGLKSVTLPKSITTIGELAFKGCENLESINLPEGQLTSIGGSAFSYCENLESIDLPEGLTTISENAFDSCKGLKSITLPKTITLIEPNAFFECTALTSVTFSDTKNWKIFEAYYDNSIKQWDKRAYKTNPTETELSENLTMENMIFEKTNP